VDHTFYRHKIGEGFIQRKPSELALAKLAYFNIDDQVTRALSAAKASARRAGYMVTVTNASFASMAHEAQKDVVEALEAGDVKNAPCLLKHVSNSLEAPRDMINNRMLFPIINADPVATSK
jgi:ribosomal protein S20